jgi:hypothetical protein
MGERGGAWSRHLAAFPAPKTSCAEADLEPVPVHSLFTRDIFVIRTLVKDRRCGGAPVSYQTNLGQNIAAVAICNGRTVSC